MKTSLEHLPKEKQDELNSIVERILAFIDPAMIILFGSYARGDWKEEADLEPDRKSGHASDYDILVITEHKSLATNKKLGGNINSSCQKLELSAHPKIITHYLKYVNERLSKGQYFFTDIVKEGILLYDSGKCQLTEAKGLTAQEQKQIAEDDFEQHFEQAKGFYDSFEHKFEKQDYKLAAFMVNQSAEGCLKVALLVCTSYVPNEHHLNILGEHCAKYDKDYSITKEQLEYLAQRVEILMGVTEKVCKEKIKSFV